MGANPLGSWSTQDRFKPDHATAQFE
jgi:hypothetical protein